MTATAAAAAAVAAQGAERRTKAFSIAFTSCTSRAEASPEDRLSDTCGGAAARPAKSAGRSAARARKAARCPNRRSPYRPAVRVIARPRNPALGRR